MSRPLERIGKLKFCRSDLIGKGHYGWVFNGSYEKCMVDLAVKSHWLVNLAKKALNLFLSF